MNDPEIALDFKARFLTHLDLIREEIETTGSQRFSEAEINHIAFHATILYYPKKERRMNAMLWLHSPHAQHVENANNIVDAAIGDARTPTMIIDAIHMMKRE